MHDLLKMAASRECVCLAAYRKAVRNMNATFPRYTSQSTLQRRIRRHVIFDRPELERDGIVMIAFPSSRRIMNC